MRRYTGPFALALALAATTAVAAAQVQKTTTRTQVKIEDGKDVTVTGCLSRAADDSFVLSNLSGDSNKTPSYQLILDDKDDADDFGKHVGHKVEVKGEVPKKGSELEIKSKTKTEIKGADDVKTESKRELKGDLSWFPVLGAKSVKMISAVCP